MSKYLKTRQEYIDLYDRLTVEDCRWRENFHKNSKPSEKLEGQVPVEFHKTVSEMALHYDLLYTTVGWYEKKESTIAEWINRDTQKDDLYDNAVAPRGIRCLQCQALTTESSKILYDNHKGSNDRVLFMYDCPNGCLPHRAFFNDGEEYRIQPKLCPKCQSVLERKDERVENEKAITTDTCPNCNHSETYELDLSPKKEVPDPDYEKDRERFCLSGETLNKNLLEKSNLESVAKFMEKWEEKEKHKDEYDEVEKLKKLTIVSLEELLIPLCEKAKYVKFQFGTPDMGKDLILPFTAHDANPNRIDLASTHDLQKIIKKAIDDTNWRLMSDGISYRMGILTGRLRAYEREEDLLELAKRRLKKINQ